MTFLPASVIDGARTYAESIRRQLYSATGGATGVILPGALKVTALPTPGGAIVIAPGSAAIASPYPGASGQSYQVANDAALQVAVPSNNTGAPINRHVWVTVRDPQYPGMPTPSNPETDTYIDVQITANTITDRPAIKLATIAMPTGASTVTPAMITDTRALAQPKELVVKVPYLPGSNVNMAKGTTYTAWAGSPQTVYIPDWTTHIIAVAHINGVEYTGTDDAVGGVRMLMNSSVDTQNGIIGSKGKSRQSVFVLGKWTLVSGAGTDAQFSIQAAQTSGAGNFQLDYQSQVLFEITFQQRIA